MTKQRAQRLGDQKRVSFNKGEGGSLKVVWGHLLRTGKVYRREACAKREKDISERRCCRFPPVHKGKRGGRIKKEEKRRKGKHVREVVIRAQSREKEEKGQTSIITRGRGKFVKKGGERSVREGSRRKGVLVIGGLKSQSECTQKKKRAGNPSRSSKGRI